MEISHSYVSLLGFLLLGALCVPAAPQSRGAKVLKANDQSVSAKTGVLWPIPSAGPERAAITVIVFSDFESFPCARSASVLADLIGESKDVRLIFMNAPAASNPNSLLAHEAAIAANAQGKFWEMHDLLFANQANLGRQDLMDYARHIGLDLAAFRLALDKHTYRSFIDRDLAEAQGLGVTTTPTFFINGRRLVGPQGHSTLQAVIDSLLAGVPRGERAENRIMASGPAQAINVKQAPALGPIGAPVSLVEFSDFECPFCAETAPVIRELLRAYPTQLRFSFKHFPLPSHRESGLAHEAALAAREQGKFWEMHDLLFASQEKLTREDLFAKAKELKLDMQRFRSDLDSRRFKQVIENDKREGTRLGVDGTPFFFVNGHSLPGAASIRDFKRLIQAALKEAVQASAK